MTAPALVAAIPLLIGVLTGTSWDAPRVYLAVLATGWSAASLALWRGYARMAMVADPEGNVWELLADASAGEDERA